MAKSTPAKKEVTQPVKIDLSAKRMLILMEHVIKSDKYPLIKRKVQFLKSFGFAQSNLWAAVHGRQSFTQEQIAYVCKLYDIDANWFVYEDHTEMHRKSKGMGVADALLLATMMAVNELKNGKQNTL